MKLTDVPESKGTFTQFGLNKFKFESFTIGDGQYGKQITFIFTRPGKEEGKDFSQTFWYQLVNKPIPVDKLWTFTNKLQEFKDVLAVVDENYEETFAEMWANAPEFDESDVDSLAKFQGDFLTQILEKVVGKEVNVVLHWKGEYLNIPSYKENDYKLPFGNNPVVYGGLNQTKVAPVVASAEPESGSTANSGW